MEDKMRYTPRSWPSIWCPALLLLFLLILPGKLVYAADNQVVMIFGGDVEWALNARPPTVRYRVADPTAYGKIVYGRRDVRDQVTGDWPTTAGPNFPCCRLGYGQLRGCSV
jgi:hypothetical protein